MPPATPYLFQPLQIGDLCLRNRITMAAMTRDRSIGPNNIPNLANVEYYTQRSGGGAALIVTEGILVSQQGTEWPNVPGLWSQEQVEGWKRVTTSVHERNAVIFAQLWHAGRTAHPEAPHQLESGFPVYAPSSIAAAGGKFRFLPDMPPYAMPTAIEDPQLLINQYAVAALMARRAGFDGVELNAAYGCLVHQFLDNTSNHRRDKWGGSPKNRCRFGLKILKVLVGVFGPRRVSVKVSPGGGYKDMGMPLQETADTFGYFIEEADKLKLAYITLVRYLANFDTKLGDSVRGTAHDVLGIDSRILWPPGKKIKVIFERRVVLMKLVDVPEHSDESGGVTPEEGAELIAAKRIDAVAFGSLFIAHPDLGKRIQHGKPLDNKVDWSRLYGTGGQSVDEQRYGYTDYPFASYADEIDAALYGRLAVRSKLPPKLEVVKTLPNILRSVLKRGSRFKNS